jgi:hypothetical protein
MVKSCLAAAQKLCPVMLCHLLVKATYAHLLIVDRNPDDVPSFLRNFKTASAPTLNFFEG